MLYDVKVKRLKFGIPILFFIMLSIIPNFVLADPNIEFCEETESCNIAARNGLQILEETYNRTVKTLMGVRGEQKNLRHVIKACLLSIFQEWEEPYLNAMSSEKLSLENANKNFEFYLRLKGLVEDNKHDLEAAFNGISAITKTEIDSRRRKGSWPRGPESLAIRLDNIYRSELDENISYCFKSDIAAQTKKSIPAYPDLTSMWGSMTNYFYNWKESSRGGVELVVTQSEQIYPTGSEYAKIDSCEDKYDDEYSEIRVRNLLRKWFSW